jgi:hypothetical protein
MLIGVVLCFEGGFNDVDIAKTLYSHPIIINLPCRAGSYTASSNPNSTLP